MSIQIFNDSMPVCLDPLWNACTLDQSPLDTCQFNYSPLYYLASRVQTSITEAYKSLKYNYFYDYFDLSLSDKEALEYCDRIRYDIDYENIHQDAESLFDYFHPRFKKVSHETRLLLRKNWFQKNAHNLERLKAAVESNFLSAYQKRPLIRNSLLHHKLQNFLLSEEMLLRLRQSLPENKEDFEPFNFLLTLMTSLDSKEIKDLLGSTGASSTDYLEAIFDLIKNSENEVYDLHANCPYSSKIFLHTLQILSSSLIEENPIPPKFLQFRVNDYLHDLSQNLHATYIDLLVNHSEVVSSLIGKELFDKLILDELASDQHLLPLCIRKQVLPKGRHGLMRVWPIILQQKDPDLLKRILKYYANDLKETSLTVFDIMALENKLSSIQNMLSHLNIEKRKNITSNLIQKIYDLQGPQKAKTICQYLGLEYDETDLKETSNHFYHLIHDDVLSYSLREQILTKAAKDLNWNVLDTYVSNSERSASLVNILSSIHLHKHSSRVREFIINILKKRQFPFSRDLLDTYIKEKDLLFIKIWFQKICSYEEYQVQFFEALTDNNNPEVTNWFIQEIIVPRLYSGSYVPKAFFKIGFPFLVESGQWQVLFNWMEKFLLQEEAPDVSSVVNLTKIGLHSLKIAREKNDVSYFQNFSNSIQQVVKQFPLNGQFFDLLLELYHALIKENLDPEYTEIYKTLQSHFPQEVIPEKFSTLIDEIIDTDSSPFQGVISSLLDFYHTFGIHNKRIENILNNFDFYLELHKKVDLAFFQNDGLGDKEALSEFLANTNLELVIKMDAEKILRIYLMRLEDDNIKQALSLLPKDESLFTEIQKSDLLNLLIFSNINTTKLILLLIQHHIHPSWNSSLGQETLQNLILFGKEEALLDIIDSLDPKVLKDSCQEHLTILQAAALQKKSLLFKTLIDKIPYSQKEIAKAISYLEAIKGAEIAQTFRKEVGISSLTVPAFALEDSKAKFQNLPYAIKRDLGLGKIQDPKLREFIFSFLPDGFLDMEMILKKTIEKTLSLNLHSLTQKYTEKLAAFQDGKDVQIPVRSRSLEIDLWKQYINRGFVDYRNRNVHGIWTARKRQDNYGEHTLWFSQNVDNHPLCKIVPTLGDAVSFSNSLSLKNVVHVASDTLSPKDKEVVPTVSHEEADQEAEIIREFYPTDPAQLPKQTC